MQEIKISIKSAIVLPHLKLSQQISPSFGNKINDKIPDEDNRLCGIVMLMKRNRKIAKRFLILKGTDLYCFKDQTEQDLVFMNTIVGCFLEAFGSQHFN